MEPADAPPLASLFQVIFDRKVGYTTAWQRSLPDLDLSGVEYKSLPSGLHGVQSDLVYFVHDGQYAGVSAFAQQEANKAHRNASFCAVGALVPLSYGRLGKSWLHAPELRQLAKSVLKYPSDTRALELFWKEHRLDNASPRQPSSPDARRASLVAGLKRKRGVSDVRDGLKMGDTIASDHPALHMPALLDSFGPLLFPLYRAALLRKRILLLGAPPVQQNCNTVYILSVLSSIPPSAAEVLLPDTDTLLRPQPLFSVGVADIAALSSNHSKAGWIAATTDDILGEKHELYDVLVDLPKGESGPKGRWPRLRTSDGKLVKATQRDLRRYRTLTAELKRLRLHRKSYSDEAEHPDADSEEAPMLEPQHLLPKPAESEELLDGEHEVCEPTSWTAAAYSSFIWWASAGSARNGLEDEEEARFERELFEDLPDLHDVLNDAPPPTDSEHERSLDAEETATTLTAYFHRLTAHFITSLAGIVDEADDETEEGVEEDAIVVTADDVQAMGLDAWSENDKAFVAEMMRLWFSREAEVAESGVTTCGIRVC